MKIVISSHTRFHMYDLARQMVRLGQFTQLYTGVPHIKLEADLRYIAKTRIRGVVAERLIDSYFPSIRGSLNISDHILVDFGRWVARKIGDVDILDALAGTGLEAGRTLGGRGTPWICNRGSTHILTQKKLLDDEHDAWQAPRIQFSSEGLDRCHAEYEEADAIVVPSTFNKRSFIKNGINGNKVYVSPYGVDLGLFHPEPKVDKIFRVIFVGTASIRKGLGYLLEALRPLVAKKNIEFWHIGAVTSELKTILQKHQDIVIYQGVQSRKDLAYYYSQGSVLVLPSIEEGLALVQAQAMACGIPIIATENSGAEDLFTDGKEGFIIPIRDSPAIREKIQLLLDCPDRHQEMKDAALRRVKDIGGWDRYGERCLSIYREVIEKKHKQNS